MATKKTDDAGAAEVERKVDAAEDKGHFGEAPDETPNTAYTVGGVLKGMPTPETHPETAPARQAQPDVRTAPARKAK